MAVDQNSIPKDLRPLTLNRAPLPFPSDSNSTQCFIPAAASQWTPVHLHPPVPSPASDSSLDGPQSAAKKIKLLCSFGGKILPRPSDGALRYVGGNTRIISVPKDTPFPDLMAKMAEASGGPAILKYQLPDEDLDALISVSGAEDLENMIDEYDKIVEASPDGSAKLRAFLFSPSEASDPSVVSDLSDTRYFEAVNGINSEGGGGTGGGLKRRDSGLSVGSSTQNSDCGAPGYEGASDSAVVSPRIGAAVSVPPQTQALNSANYLPINSYVDPHQVQYLNSQHVNLVQFPAHVSAAVASSVTQVNSLKPVQPPPRLDDNLYGGIQNYKGVQPPPQLPPLPLSYQQVPNVEPYGLHKGPAQGQGFRLDDCYMCQKALPHAHSDPVVQDFGNGSPGSGPEVIPMFYSQRVGEPMRSPAQLLVNGGLADNAVEAGVDSTTIGGRLGACGFPQVSEVQFESARPLVQKIENLDHARVFVPPGSMGLSPDAQSSYGLFLGNFPEYHQEELLQQQQQLQSQQNLGMVQYPVKPEMIARPVGNDASLIGNMRPVATPEFSYDHAKPVNAMMEGLHLNTTGVSALNGQGKAVARPNPGSPVGLNSDGLSLVAENSHASRPQVGGNAVFLDREFANPSIVPDGNYVKTIDQPPKISDLTQMHNLQPADTSQVPTVPGTHNPYTHYLGTRAEPPMPSQGLLVMPPYHSGMNPSYNDSANSEIATGDLKDVPTQFSTKDMIDLLAAPYNGNAPFNLSNATHPTELLEPFQEPLSSNSLFCNQDPRKILGGAHPLPPKPRRVASKESIAAKDSNVVTHLGNSNESDIIALLEEGGLHPFSVSQNKDTRLEPVQTLKGSGDEQIKQNLQAVAEDVATSVLQSSLSQEMKEANLDFKDERKVAESSSELQAKVIPMGQKIEDSKRKQSDKMNAGVRITNDIGRLQIINNNDLEELRELGSGTFGTVYLGKWRGTDVAIKRINDRCFAGKPSEQERMRADFWNEACNLADLHHPNVVAFYGVVLDGPGGSVATVTEYMVNGSLRNALQRNEKTLDRRKRLLIAMDVAFGMEYLHGKNIVHFDLKSDNLLVNLRDPQRPICKVGDLGLSKVKCQTLISGGVRGTLPWMAPELLNGISSLVSEKVDVFSFGIVMWELLTGQEPYADLHYGAIIGGIVSNKLRPPIPESCDAEWKSLMEQCWSADPSERPSFTEIANRLRSMAASLPAKGQAQAQGQK